MSIISIVNSRVKDTDQLESFSFSLKYGNFEINKEDYMVMNRNTYPDQSNLWLELLKFAHKANINEHIQNWVMFISEPNCLYVPRRVSNLLQGYHRRIKSYLSCQLLSNLNA